MPTKKTIAIVGATESKVSELVYQFAKSDFRLLLISNEVTSLSHLSESIAATNPHAEVEFLECVKDGCWEADIIILAIRVKDETDVAQLMKDVATQKIVVEVSNEKNAGNDLKSILPYSKLVMASGDFTSKEIVLNGDSEEVIKEISAIFIQAGYYVSIANDAPQQRK